MSHFRMKSARVSRHASCVAKMVVGLSFAIGFTCSSYAQTSQAEKYSQQEIRTLIKSLESSRYAERQRATKKLANAGANALGEIAKQVVSGTPETASRCSRLLTQIALKSDESGMTRASRILVLLTRNGFGHLQSDASNLQVRWKEMQTERTVEKIRSYGITVVEMDRGVHFLRHDHFSNDIPPPPGYSPESLVQSTGDRRVAMASPTELVESLDKIMECTDEENSQLLTAELAQPTVLDAPKVGDGTSNTIIFTERAPLDATVIVGERIVVRGGGIVTFGGGTSMPTSASRYSYNIEIGESFDGSVEAINYLNLLPSIEQVSISNRTVERELLEVIASQGTVRHLSLQACKYDLEPVLEFMRASQDCYVEATGHDAFLGVTIENSYDEDSGNTKCMISSIVEGTAAEECGCEIGDIVNKIQGVEVRNLQELIVAIGSFDTDAEVVLDITRNEEAIQITAKLKSRPVGQ